MPRLSRRKSAIRVQAAAEAQLADYVHTVAFSSDGRRLAACAASGQVAVWDIDGCDLHVS